MSAEDRKLKYPGEIDEFMRAIKTHNIRTPKLGIVTYADEETEEDDFMASFFFPFKSGLVGVCMMQHAVTGRHYDLYDPKQTVKHWDGSLVDLIPRLLELDQASDDTFYTDMEN